MDDHKLLVSINENLETIIKLLSRDSRDSEGRLYSCPACKMGTLLKKVGTIRLFSCTDCGEAYNLWRNIPQSV